MSTETAMAPDHSESPSHFNLAALSSDMSESRAAVRAVLETFAPWLADTRQQLHAAIAGTEIAQLARVAHRLRGALSQLRAAQAVALVKKIEAYGKAHPDVCIARDHPLLAELDAELDALAGEVAAQLEALRQSGVS